jgi:hypothetical protein
MIFSTIINFAWYYFPSKTALTNVCQTWGSCILAKYMKIKLLSMHGSQTIYDAIVVIQNYRLTELDIIRCYENWTFVPLYLI